MTALATNGRELFVGGGFSMLAGAPRSYLASFDLQTGALTSWHPGLDGSIASLRSTGDTLYAVGPFSRADGEPRAGIAAFDTRARTVLDFAVAPGPPSDAAIYRDRLLLSGWFFNAGGALQAFRWVDRVSGADVPPVTDVGAYGFQVVEAGGTIYATTVSLNPPFTFQLWAIDGATGRSTALQSGITSLNAASDGYLAGIANDGTLVVYRTPRARAPQAITAAVVNSTVSLAWRPSPPPAVASFVIEAGSTPGATDLGAFAVGAATTATGSVAAGTYYTRVRSVGSNGPGAASSEVVLTVPALAAAPSTPGALTYSVSAGEVRLDWGAAAGNATTYVLEAGTRPGVMDIGAVATGNLDTSFTTVAPRGTYVIRVRAANAFGVSPPTNEVTVVVP